MKTVLIYIASTLALLSILFVVMYGMRMFSNATTPLVLHNPKPGVTCATLVTSDGAAISCWKD